MNSLLDLVNPLYFFRKVASIVKELNNFYFYHKKLHEIKKSGMYRFQNLKIDKINRVYTFINLPPEMLMTTNNNELERMESEIVGANILKYSKFLDDNGLIELYKFKYIRVKNEDYYGYKLYTRFRFNHISIWSLLYVLIYTKIILYLIHIISIAGIAAWIKSIIATIKNIF
jgi:hypothetical protein